MLTDEQLVERYRASGRPEHLEELVGRHLRRVRSLMFQMVLHDDDADELTQDAVLRALRGLPRFDGRSSFATWIYRIAMNVARSHLANRGRRRVYHDAGAVDALVSAEPGPARTMLGSELGDEIAVALAELPETLRAAIVLVTLQGFEPKRAAEIEGCATATIYWRLSRARRILHQRLGDYLSS